MSNSESGSANTTASSLNSEDQIPEQTKSMPPYSQINDYLTFQLSPRMRFPCYQSGDQDKLQTRLDQLRMTHEVLLYKLRIVKGKAQDIRTENKRLKQLLKQHTEYQEKNKKACLIWEERYLKATTMNSISQSKLCKNMSSSHASDLLGKLNVLVAQLTNSENATLEYRKTLNLEYLQKMQQLYQSVEKGTLKLTTRYNLIKDKVIRRYGLLQEKNQRDVEINTVVQQNLENIMVTVGNLSKEPTAEVLALWIDSKIKFLAALKATKPTLIKPDCLGLKLELNGTQICWKLLETSRFTTALRGDDGIQYEHHLSFNQVKRDFNQLVRHRKPRCATLLPDGMIAMGFSTGLELFDENLVQPRYHSVYANVHHVASNNSGDLIALLVIEFDSKAILIYSRRNFELSPIARWPCHYLVNQIAIWDGAVITNRVRDSVCVFTMAGELDFSINLCFGSLSSERCTGLCLYDEESIIVTSYHSGQVGKFKICAESHPEWELDIKNPERVCTDSRTGLIYVQYLVMVHNAHRDICIISPKGQMLKDLHTHKTLELELMLIIPDGDDPNRSFLLGVKPARCPVYNSSDSDGFNGHPLCMLMPHKAYEVAWFGIEY